MRNRCWPRKKRAIDLPEENDRSYSLWRWGVTSHVLDVSYETPDVTPCRTSPPIPLFAHLSRETPDVSPCHTSPPQGADSSLLRFSRYTFGKDTHWESLQSGKSFCTAVVAARSSAVGGYFCQAPLPLSRTAPTLHHPRVCVYIYIYIYTYIPTYIHTYIHTYLCTSPRPPPEQTPVVKVKTPRVSK